VNPIKMRVTSVIEMTVDHPKPEYAEQLQRVGDQLHNKAGGRYVWKSTTRPTVAVGVYGNMQPGRLVPGGEGSYSVRDIDTGITKIISHADFLKFAETVNGDVPDSW